jgi:hypothetical protein
MLLAEHNAKWGAQRSPGEQVHCHTLGYGEFSQYDPRCAACWLGHPHAWKEHDRSIRSAVAAEEKHARVNGRTVYRVNVLVDGEVVGEYLNHTGDLEKTIAQAVELIRGGVQVAAHVWSGAAFLAEVTTDHNGTPTVERQAGGDPQVWVECRA